jgi:hypothetical protein
MSEFSNWGQVEPLVQLPKPVKKAIQKKVMARLSMARFIGSIVDLYIGKAGETLAGLAETFNEENLKESEE